MDDKFKNFFGGKRAVNNETNQTNGSNLLNSKLIIIFDFIQEDSNSNMTLFDVKNKINSLFNIHEYEYELFINEIPISQLEDEVVIRPLLNKYNTNTIIIKAYKNIFDIQNDLNNYEHFLSNNISLKNNEINKLNIEYENIKKDLQNL